MNPSQTDSLQRQWMECEAKLSFLVTEYTSVTIEMTVYIQATEDKNEVLCLFVIAFSQWGAIVESYYGNGNPNHDKVVTLFISCNFFYCLKTLLKHIFCVTYLKNRFKKHNQLVQPMYNTILSKTRSIITRQ